MKNASRTLLSLAAAAALAACSGDSDPTPAPTRLLGVTYGDSQLVELDANTGAFLRTIGPVGYRVNGLEYDRTTGKLFATTSNGDANFRNGLLEIDLATGAGTPVGTGFGFLVNNPTVNSAGELYAWTEETDDLVLVDKAAGTATVVGESGLDTWEHGLAFDPQDRLVFVNGDGEFHALDAATGAATPLPIELLGRAHHGDFDPRTGFYWGVAELNWSVEGPARTLRVYDLASRTLRFGVETADDLFAITFK